MIPVQVLSTVLALCSSSPEPAADPGVMKNLERRLTRHTRERYVGDLAVIKKKGVLRVLTRNNSSAYFINRGAEHGFQLELARAFAKELGVRIAFVVPTSRAALQDALFEGQGDIIAAGMTVTPARAEKIRFTRPVLEASRVIVTRAGQPPTIDLEKLPIHISFRSTTYRDAIALQAEKDASLVLRDVTDGVEMEEMMRRVATGTYAATIVDSNLADQQRAAGLEIEARLPIGSPRPKAWAVHPAAPRLRAVADAFIHRSSRNGLIRILYARYYRATSRWVRRALRDEYRADKSGQISPYDALFKEAGKDTDLDWRLLAAVAHTESRFDPKAASRFGAVGLMQLLPSTAKELGVRGDLTDPRTNIRAGARYLRWLVKRFDAGIDTRQRIRFALASYNAGLGHVFDARRLAADHRLNPDRWFKNVERALLLKKQRRFHERTRYGYCRADETVGYVSAVQSRYDLYAQHVPL